MLNQYKNINQIVSASKSSTGDRISKSKTEFFGSQQDAKYVQVPDITRQTDDIKLEFHVYAGDSWITGNHQVQNQSKIPNYVDKNTKAPITFPAQPVAINISQDLKT